MKPLTNYIHKCMIPFSGFPLLAYSPLSIPEGAEVVIIVNYLEEQIANYFGDSYQGKRIRYLKQKDPQGTGDALFQFSEAYQPKHPVVVRQADQMIFPEEVGALTSHEPNAAVCSESSDGRLDLGFWKIKPRTLARLRSCLDRGEYRALPVLEQEGLRQIKTPREKLEISFETWDKIELQCKRLKQKLPVGRHTQAA